MCLLIGMLQAAHFNQQFIKIETHGIIISAISKIHAFLSHIFNELLLSNCILHL